VSLGNQRGRSIPRKGSGDARTLYPASRSLCRRAAGIGTRNAKHPGQMPILKPAAIGA
jgi:hypothetical protein